MTRWCGGCGSVTGHRWDCPLRPADEETPRHHEGDEASGPGANPGGDAPIVAPMSTPWSGAGAVRASDPAVDAVWEAWVRAPYGERLAALNIGLGDFLDMVRDAVAAVRRTDAANDESGGPS